ncbi:Methylthioribose-1-phosphate isomerase [Zancudomyces culisetae]|uniref:Methylthioribose-1-phosphate isomerase n=1 Tax=Zancudomyces culisetae TaxID=1213189 RepID=A0A1R1PYF3_ZANCU|nr:Methylthioribose-1-phosphate isomerase [Zancudomyces culisetae]|eukprot:OMH85992.1 Methylthioribose-1-phosphate isomerase [Zancudomyces culisetae]
MERKITTSMSALKWNRPNLEIIDQLLLPHEQVWLPIKNAEEAHKAIKTMQVRGAPAIGVVAGLGLATDLLHKKDAFQNEKDLLEYIAENTAYLRSARPTAVNLFEAMDRMDKHVETEHLRLKESKEASGNTLETIIETIVREAETLLENDVLDNRAIGKYGAEYLVARHGESRFSVLTHCNTGSLATAGYGTALGIIRALWEKTTQMDHVYCTETRPYNQGSRLTAYELHEENIDFSLVCDSAVSWLIKTSNQPAKTINNSLDKFDRSPVKAIIVGADRVTANGDTANKVGTYQLAIVAKNFGVDFIVAVPSTTIDLSLDNGSSIPIEYRSGTEVTNVSGVVLESADQQQRKGNGIIERSTVRVSPFGDFEAYNPSFDVTPCELITAIVTEKGVITKDASTGQFDVKGFLEKHN